VAASLASSQNGLAVADKINKRFQLSGTASAAVNALFARPPGATGAITFGSVVLLLWSGVSLSRGIQSTFELAWDLPPTGVRGTVNSAAALGLLVSELLLLSLFAGLLRNVSGGTVLSFVLRLGASCVLWLVLLRVYLSMRIAWRALVPAAIVMGIG